MQAIALYSLYLELVRADMLKIAANPLVKDMRHIYSVGSNLRKINRIGLFNNILIICNNNAK